MRTRFNHIDILQAKHYVKLLNMTYIENISSHHHLLANGNTPRHEFPIPMNAENDYKRQLEMAILCIVIRCIPTFIT